MTWTAAIACPLQKKEDQGVRGQETPGVNRVMLSVTALALN